MKQWLTVTKLYDMQMLRHLRAQAHAPVRLRQGTISEISYMWPRPGSTDPVPKVSFVTKVDDQVCAVGYYK